MEQLLYYCDIFIASMSAIEKAGYKKNDESKLEHNAAKNYMEGVRMFLATFKTNLCDRQYQHQTSICPDAHTHDTRRNPYFKHSFKYFPDKASVRESIPDAVNLEEHLCINETQYLYHPTVYKTQRCPNFFNCPHHLFCPYLHHEDQCNFQYGQFFRFNIRTHKTKHCPRREHHERKTCIYYHNDLDRRRANSDDYSHELCPNRNCKNNHCSFSHNKIQQVYHPSRYKTKFCQTYSNKSLKCDYKEFCAFAHTQTEIQIQMIHLLTRDHNFFMFVYKTVWCPDTLPHDRSNCVYAHNIQDFRRNPQKHAYLPEKCPNWSFDEELKSIEDSGCKQGMNCDKCHGWMEQRYHPKIYKKGKNDKEVTSMIDKKLQNKTKQTKQKTNEPSRISQVVEEKCTETLKNNTVISHNVGAPFFKKEVTSESSRRSKAITTHIESDDSYNREEQPRVQIKQSESKKSISIRNKSMFLFSEDQIWRNVEDEKNQFERELNEERARSENKFDQCETVFSHSLKQTVGDSQILKKLKNNNINGIKIKNLNENQISDFLFLTNQEKEKLTHKIKIYQLRREHNPLIYSLELTKFFIKKKKESILEKTRVKKIKEDRLLGMKVKDIESLQFLSKEEKLELPILIEQYKAFVNDKEFNLINQDIVKFVRPRES